MNIVFVLFDNVTQLDFTGPVQFLSRLPGAKVHVVSKDGAAVKTDCGFQSCRDLDLGNACKRMFYAYPAAMASVTR